jgi:hypothetical protein
VPSPPLALCGTVVLFVLAARSPDVRADDGAQPAPPSAPVSATASPSPSHSHLPLAVDVGLGTYFPLSFVGEATVELPFRILAQADLGWMPQAYSNTIVNLLGDFGVLTSVEQQLLKSAIQNSLVAKFSGGWRPFRSLGLEVLAGYTMITVGGSTTAAQVIDAFLGSKGSTDKLPTAANTPIPLGTTLNAFHVTLGYRFLFLRDHLVLRTSLSYLQCFSSSTGVAETLANPSAQAIVNRVNADIQGFLNPYFTQYAKLPVFGLTAAYRF